MTILNGMIAELERRRKAVNDAVEALRGINVEEQPDLAKYGGRSTAGRQRQIEAMRRYWAARKAGKSPTRKAARKGGLTAKGRRALSLYMKKRWAAKRAAEKMA